MSNRPIAIDLFSGCGGMSLGLEAAGFDIAASVEIDPIHCLVHHYNFPYGVTICQDISQLSSQELLNSITHKGFNRNIDLIAGGPPCQGFSQIGKRQLDDPRNQLVFEYLRIVSEVKPKYFIFENVPGMATGKHQHFLNELITEFAKSDYSVVQPIKVLDASLYGAPQKRKRLILIGYRKDLPKPKYPAYTHGDNNLQPLNTVSSAIGDLSNISVFIGDDWGIDAQKLDYSQFRENFAIDQQGKYSLCHQRVVDNIVWGHIGSMHTEKSIKRFKQTLPSDIEKVSRFFKLAPDGISNTLRAGTASNRGAYTAPRPIHYQIPRCISVREAARLHTFPDWFQFHRTIWHGFREIGNAVIPLLAKSLGEEIIKCLNVDLLSIKIKKLAVVDSSILSYNMRQASAFWQVPSDVIPKRTRLKI
ncbi:DNA-cytosine methyltransferase [Stanieria cyanosphaera PCC 7437]|uniref:Cytosine-specific methyltransferase n=1 Tax=Stanieria cyanosphaera (strain ATCC 29371 / PCC 7437) TaxID=111780 RepID=K9XVK6_STAC7|nr:DNA cytosine methyltransferase [Stanieria cyanosphaera]AFZ36111.1 DNA-cytosine methyltransferase [Stanieria cyanosphaera PCC 7437]